MSFKSLEGEGGHLAVVIFVFGVGVAMSIAGMAVAHDVVVGSLASLWTLLRIGSRPTGEKNDERTAAVN